MKSGNQTDTFVSKIEKILNPGITADLSDDDESTAKVENFIEDDSSENEEETLSSFRRNTVNLLSDIDRKYEGTKCSRKRLNEDDSDTNKSEVEDSIDNDIESDENYSGEEDYESESHDSQSISDHDENGKQITQNANVITLKTENSQQHEKGNAVKNQIKIWESLLEMRIEMQKALIPANKMPDSSYFEKMRSNTEMVDFQNKVTETSENVENLLEKFMRLQRLLVNELPDTVNAEQQELDENEEIPSDSENDLESNQDNVTTSKKRKLNDYSTEIAEFHEKYKTYRNNLINKWNTKTKLSNTKTENQVSIVNQIEYSLNNMPKLIKRTQLNRGGYEILGREKKIEETEEYIPEIFDDTDFYQQLLRELIKVKSADITDPEQLSRQWVQLQDCRNKMKAKVDTRATKGRKIRYAIHSKLVNFMAPIDNLTWSNEAKDEFYSSLFGKNEIKNS